MRTIQEIQRDRQTLAFNVGAFVIDHRSKLREFDALAEALEAEFQAAKKAESEASAALTPASLAERITKLEAASVAKESSNDQGG